MRTPNSKLLVVEIKTPYTDRSIKETAEEIAKLTREPVDIYDDDVDIFEVNVTNKPKG